MKITKVTLQSFRAFDEPFELNITGGKNLLLYGEKTPKDFAYRDEMQRWEEKIKILRVVSRPKGTEWEGLAGHVQDHLKGQVTDSKDTIVCFSGMKEMIEDATDLLVEMGDLGVVVDPVEIDDMAGGKARRRVIEDVL